METVSLTMHQASKLAKTQQDFQAVNEDGTPDYHKRLTAVRYVLTTLNPDCSFPFPEIDLSNLTTKELATLDAILSQVSP